MANHPLSGRLFGALMLAHLALGLIGPYVVLVPMTAPPGGFLEQAADMAAASRAAVLALVVGAALPLVMAVGLWARGEGRAMVVALLALASVNLALQVAENALWLSMLTVSEAYREGATTESFMTVSVTLRALFRWSHYGHITILVAWILLLFATCWRHALLPRWLAALGVITCLLHLGAIPMPEFLGLRLANAALWGVPLAAVYLLTATVLIARGFPRDVQGVAPP